MANKDVQQKLCTEPGTTVQETIQFVISNEEGAIRQQSFEKLDKPNIKQEPSEVNNIISGVKKWDPSIFRCETVFSPQHIKESKAMGITCMKCGKKRHFAKGCQTKGEGNFDKSRKVKKTNSTNNTTNR